MSNKITLRSWAGKAKEYRFYPLPQKNGINYPFVKKVRVNSDGSTEMILSDAERNSEESQFFIPEDMEIVVTDGTTFDLDDPLQRNIWTAIKDHDLIVPSIDARDENGNLSILGSPGDRNGEGARYGFAELWIDVPGEDTRKSVAKKKLIAQAYNFIADDSISGLLTKCKLLGKIMLDAPESDIQDFIYSRAEKNPQEIISLYTDGDTKLRLLILDAKSRYVIKKASGLYMYAETILGATDDAVLTFLKQPSNKGILDLIKAATYPEYAAAMAANPVVAPVQETPVAKAAKTAKKA